MFDRTEPLAMRTTAAESNVPQLADSSMRSLVLESGEARDARAPMGHRLRQRQCVRRRPSTEQSLPAAETRTSLPLNCFLTAAIVAIILQPSCSLVNMRLENQRKKLAVTQQFRPLSTAPLAELPFFVLKESDRQFNLAS
jgi:hypothetical protein